MLFTLASCAALVSLAAIPQARAIDIPVIVGGAGVLTYQPPSVTAAVGDRIVFTFREKNHTATQSTLAAPCVPAPNGFDSGFVPVSAGDVTGSKTAIYTVQSLDAVWVYCKQGNHCQQGMVFAVNPADKLAQFQAAAKGGAAAPAATSGAPASPTSTGVPSTNDHKVIVGGPGKLVFTPSTVTAKVGDTITFQFQQKNHTVTQSTFGNPCKSIASTSTTGQVGFDSGFKPVADGATTFPSYTIQVNDTQPIWAFCAQGNHCTSGMVFAANTVETGTNTFDAFKNKAMGSGGGAATPSGTPAAGGALKVSSGAGFAGILIAAVAVWLL